MCIWMNNLCNISNSSIIFQLKDVYKRKTQCYKHKISAIHKNFLGQWLCGHLFSHVCLTDWLVENTQHNTQSTHLSLHPNFHCYDFLRTNFLQMFILLNCTNVDINLHLDKVSHELSTKARRVITRVSADNRTHHIFLKICHLSIAEVKQKPPEGTQGWNNSF
jgi:hypothetical protein